MRQRTRFRVAVAVLLVTSMPAGVWGSYAIYVGKNLTTDGSVILAGYGDEPSSHWIDIVPAREWPEGTKIKVGATPRARFPGELIEIPQVRRTARYISVNYSAFAGFPGPLTNGGLNEHGVAARDVWSPSRTELRQMTPVPQRGLSYSDLSRIVMERARTAQEAVEIVGELIDKYGYATYGGNSHLFADANEGWVLIEFAGGQKLWVAERLGPDDIRVSRPGYIGEMPVDFEKHPQYRGSRNLVTFAVDQGWFDPKAGKPFNVNQVYGDGQMRHRGVVLIEERLRAKAKSGKISLVDVMAAVRDPELTGDMAGYGQVVQLRRVPHPDLAVLWIAPATPTAAPFLPFSLGVTGVPPEYQRHRYLTEGEAERFMERHQQGIESTRYAFQECKRLFYLMNEHPKEFQPEVTKALEAFEANLIAEQATVERTAQTLYAAGEPELARRYLTYYSQAEAMNGLRLVQALANSIEARTKVRFGIRAPAGPPPPAK
ncbi:MAG: C69 family dipeptidase [Gemmataceae bacterium]|nr:C69 family dipeptidase [Gemmataceae bacterium]MDW8264216.1 C69 family dipeptidase [Gemmataceae bacterium]